jgi:hypothetical protein
LQRTLLHILTFASELLSKTSAEVKDVVESQDTLLSEVREIFKSIKEFIPPVDESLTITKTILKILESPQSVDSDLKPLCERLMKLEVAASRKHHVFLPASILSPGVSLQLGILTLAQLLTVF